jgi:hypothetical protein
MKPGEVSRTKRPVPTSHLLADPRFNELDVARRHGYTDLHLNAIMGGLGSFERQLAHRFGAPLFDRVKFKEIRFVTGDERMGTGGIGLEYGKNLLVDPAKLPAPTFSRRLIPLLAHEYAHALTLNPKILWESLSEQQKWGVGVDYRGVREAQGLDHLSHLSWVRIFILALGSGLNNPFISGLKTDKFDTSAIYEAARDEGCDYDMAEAITDVFVGKALELITERVADLIVNKTPRFNAAVREGVQEYLESLKNPGPDSFRFVVSAHAMYARVYAEKTGNADLLHDLERENFGSLHTELCRVLSALWDQIGLKRS